MNDEVCTGCADQLKDTERPYLTTYFSPRNIYKTTHLVTHSAMHSELSSSSNTLGTTRLLLIIIVGHGFIC